MTKEKQILNDLTEKEAQKQWDEHYFGEERYPKTLTK